MVANSNAGSWPGRSFFRSHLIGDTQMKSVKVFVLTFFLALTGYGYTSGITRASSDSDHAKTASSTVERACCMAKAECCKPGAECCKPGAPCCKADMSCEKECCNASGSCLAKADSANRECCSVCGGCSAPSAKADRTSAKADTKGCCGSSCNRTGSTKQ